MRILFLCAFVPYPVRDGDCVRADLMLRLLSRRHKVYGFFLDPRGKGVVPAEAKRHCEEAVAVPVGYRHMLMGGLRGLALGHPLNAGSFWSGRAWRRLKKCIRRWRVDGLHVHRLRMMPYAERLDKPFILDATDSMASYFKLVKDQPWGWRRFYARLDYPALRHYERKWANMSAACLAITSVEQDKIEKLGVRKPVLVVPNGFDPGRWRFVGPADRGREALFLGNLDYPVNAKGLEWFLKEIAPRVARLAPGARLTVAGGGRTGRFRKFLEKAGMDVEFTGYVKDPRVLLHRASVMLCPLPQAVGLQNKAVQAFACGAPVVGTTNVARALGAEPGVEMFVADDPEMFARMTARIIRDRGLRGRLARAGRRLAVLNFSEASAARSLERAEAILAREVRQGGR